MSDTNRFLWDDEDIVFVDLDESVPNVGVSATVPPQEDTEE